MLSEFATKQIQEALERRCGKEGYGVIQVNPAYTSSNWERKIQPEDGLYSAHGRFVCDCEARNGISELNRNAVLQSVQR